MSNYKNLHQEVIGNDGEGFDLTINTCNEGAGWVACGEETMEVTPEQSEMIMNGDQQIINDGFGFTFNYDN